MDRAWLPEAKEVQNKPSAGKVMATVFWDAKGVMLNFLPQRSTITGVYYANLLDQLNRHLDLCCMMTVLYFPYQHTHTPSVLQGFEKACDQFDDTVSGWNPQHRLWCVGVIFFIMTEISKCLYPLCCSYVSYVSNY